MFCFKKLKIFVIFLLGVIALTSFAQEQQEKEKLSPKQQAIEELEIRINKALLPVKKGIISKYREMWADTILNYDFQDIMQSNIQLYNQLLTIQQDYRKSLQTIEETYPDTELQELDKKFAAQKEEFFKILAKDLEKEILKLIPPAEKKKFEKELSAENFMTTAFEEIPFFAKQKKILDAIQALKTKKKPDFEKIEIAYQTQKKEILEMRAQRVAKRNAFFNEELAKLEAEPEKEKEETFMDNFWIGIKGGVNFSTGSESTKAEAAGGLGLVAEYTIFKIRPIAFEASIEFNFNYIQKPVAISQGTINTDYINLPIFGKGKWPCHIPLGFGDLTPFIGIGIDPYLRLSSNFVSNENGKSYVFDTKGFNIGFVWNLGGELNLFDLVTATLEFRMSLGASSGIPAYTIPLGNLGYTDVLIPEQRQQGYMIFIGAKMPLSRILFFF